MAVIKGDEMGSNIAPAVKKDPKFRILLEDNAAIPPGGLFICGNGRTFLAQAGVELSVPQIVLEILDNAIESIPRVDPLTGQVRQYISRKKYPYQKLGAVAA
jgi:hypothetical protein